MRTTWWKSGDWNAICDSCGFKFKASELKKRWDGFMVCEQDFETRHPQDFIRPLPDQKSLPWTRPEGEDQFITSSGFCTVITRQGVADYGTADCAMADFDVGAR